MNIEKIKLEFEGEKLICISKGSKALEAELRETIGDLKAIAVNHRNNIEGEYEASCVNTTYFLKKSDYKRYKQIKREREKPKRDLSGIMHLEARFEPEWWEKIMDYSIKYPCSYTKPDSFLKIFRWKQTEEGHDFWNVVHMAFKNNTLHECLVEPFKWIKDYPPTKDDANQDGMIMSFSLTYNSRVGLRSWEESVFKLGLPWAPVSAMKQFSAENPAPSPFEHD